MAMIKNERQLRVAERKLSEVRSAIESTTDPNEVRSLEDFAHELKTEIDEFMNITGGFINSFRVGSMDDLPDALIKSRIAKGWSQGDLAEELGVSPQMVQKDEAGGYERAGIDRLADVADALGYELRGVLHPKSETATFHILRIETMPAATLRFGERTAETAFFPNCLVRRRDRPTGRWEMSEPVEAVWAFHPSSVESREEFQAGTTARIGIFSQREGALQ